MGDDRLFGQCGNDTLSGSAGDDVLIGVAGSDTLLDGVDSDTHDGGAGDDSLAGHGNYEGTTIGDTGHTSADEGATFTEAIDSDTIGETSL